MDAARLAAAAPGGPEGEILLLSAGRDRQWDRNTPEFWRHAPWLTPDAAERPLSRRPTAVAFAFPQDFPIRLLLDGVRVPFEQHLTHDVLLRAGVTLIEYLVNTAALPGTRLFALEGLAA
jgi:kynurenine formamidase